MKKKRKKVLKHNSIWTGRGLLRECKKTTCKGGVGCLSQGGKRSKTEGKGRNERDTGIGGKKH